MLLSHSCYICGTWRSKEVGALKPSYREKGARQRRNFYGDIATSASLFALPTYLSLFWHKKSSMICTT